MRFIKMHGTGNDFIIVPGGADELSGVDHATSWGEAASILCDRHFGIGSDGVLLLSPSDVAAFRMQTFNPDGSEAEMCGNGIRCVAKYAVESGMVANPSDKAGLKVSTLGGIKTVWPVISNGLVTGVRVDMEPPELAPARVPVAVESENPVLDHRVIIDGSSMDMTFVSMGNPHAIVFLDTPVDQFPLERVGPIVELDPLFPKRTNFEVVNVLGRDRLRVRVWERGAGLTMACGTGACAVMVAASLKGLVDETVTIELPGGELILEWDGTGPVFMTGAVESVFEGDWSGTG
jgi:diaminopimelate epimerase